MSTIADVKKAYDDAYRPLVELDGKLTDERRQIERKAFGNPTAAQTARINEINAQKAKLSKAIALLNSDTVDAYNRASDVDDMLKQLDQINKGLKDDLAELQKVADYADTVARVTAGLASAVEQLAKLKPTLLG